MPPEMILRYLNTKVDKDILMVLIFTLLGHFFMS